MVVTIAIVWPFKNQTIQNPIKKKSGFWMFPDLEGLDFRSPLYITLDSSEYWTNGPYFLFCIQIINTEQKVWIFNGHMWPKGC